MHRLRLVTVKRVLRGLDDSCVTDPKIEQIAQLLRERNAIENVSSGSDSPCLRITWNSRVIQAGSSAVRPPS
jgi:hypothetical protein